jgi:hypothetical protein
MEHMNTLAPAWDAANGRGDPARSTAATRLGTGRALEAAVLVPP